MRHALWSLLFLLACGALPGQSIFQIRELALYNDKGEDSTTLIKDGGIAEINSTLRITFNKSAIGWEVRRLGGGAALDRPLLAKLKILLRNQVRAMALLAEKADAPNFDGLGELTEFMLPFYEEVATDPELGEFFNQAFAEYEARYGDRRDDPSVVGADLYILSYFNALATRYTQQISASATNQDVRFAFYGFLRSRRGTRPVRLSDQFDNLAEEYYVVPRWAYSLSEEDKQELREISGLIQRIDGYKSQVEGRLKAMLADCFTAADCLEDLETRLGDILDDAATRLPEYAGRIEAQLLGPYQEVRSLVRYYTENEKAGAGISDADLLIGFDADLQRTQRRVDSLLQHLDEGLAAILLELPNDPALLALKALYEDCRRRLEADRDQIILILRDLSGMLEQAGKTVASAEAMTEQIRRLDFDQVPEVTFVDLQTTGPRDNGDQLILKAALVQEVDGQEVSRIIDQRRFTLQQIGVYSIVKPILVLANPIGNGDKVSLQSQFQFAPAYSILFKWGSRRSHAFNTFWSPGIGINFSAADFNTDGTPEFGAGLELSLIRDYLALGTGYNFGADEPYYFLGFRLPFGAVPLPIFNNVASQE